MATSRTPAIIDALVTACRAALTNVLVTDGKGVTLNPGDYLMVGVDDPEADGMREASDSRHTWSGLGNHARDQEGDLWFVAGSVDGGNDAKVARDAAYAVMAEVEDIVRTDPTVSAVISSGWALTSSERLTQGQTNKGAHARVAFQIHFKTRL